MSTIRTRLDRLEHHTATTRRRLWDAYYLGSEEWTAAERRLLESLHLRTDVSDPFALGGTEAEAIG